jgi:DNA-binding NtrC family response regulator
MTTPRGTPAISGARTIVPAVLVVEHDAVLRNRLGRALGADGTEIVDACGEAEALAAVAATAFDVVVLGSSGPNGETSLEVARRMARLRADLRIILITAESSEALAIAALRAGVRDYFRHPVPFDELAASVRRWLAVAPLAAPQRRLPAPAGPRLIGCGPRMHELQTYLQQVAVTDSTVLITGETGTGKELTAALIHATSRRRERPFLHINCAAIPDTLLESELFGYERGAFTGAAGASPGKLKAADGGTVLFDEIGDMSVYAQAKILRLIESREIERLGGRRAVSVDVRVIAATNHDLERLMAEGRFRKDLYFRLNVVRIHLPPLRERKEDLLPLVEHYVDEFSRLFGREVDGVTDDALAALCRHDWPGNVRELRNVVESVFTTLRSRRIAPADLPPAFRGAPGSAGVPETAGERDRLIAALSETRWNKSKAAARLHWSRMTVYRKMAKYRLVETRRIATDRAS